MQQSLLGQIDVYIEEIKAPSRGPPAGHQGIAPALVLQGRQQGSLALVAQQVRPVIHRLQWNSIFSGSVDPLAFVGRKLGGSTGSVYRCTEVIPHVGNGKGDVEIPDVLDRHDEPFCPEMLVVERVLRPFGRLDLLVLDVREHLDDHSFQLVEAL